MEWAILDVLSDEERRQLLAGARRRRFGRDEVIFHEGDPGDTLHLIAQGHVAIRVTTPLGDTATLRIIKAGEFFGELALVSPAPRNATAIAMEGAETVTIHRAQLEELRVAHPGVDRVLVEVLATEIRRLAVQLLDALYLPVDKRIWRRLVELADVVGSVRNGAIVIPLTQDGLAQVVGTTRPTVNRLLRSAEEAGTLKVGRGRLEILDREDLARRAR